MHRLTFGLIAVGVTLSMLTTPARATDLCPPCEPDIDIRVEVPLKGRNYGGPAKYEGDIFGAFGRSFSVSILIDGTRKPPVFLSIMNPGVKQFIRWTTAALILPRGNHVMVITIVDLANPECADVRTIHFATR